MKKLIVIVAVMIIIIATTTTVHAQWMEVTPSSQAQALADARAERTLVREAASAVNQINIYCGQQGQWTRCAPALVAADRVRDKATTGVSARWVRTQLKRALEGYATKAELEAVQDEFARRLAELDRRIAEIEAQVAVLEQRADAGERKDAEQDNRLDGLEERMDDAEAGIAANRVAIARAGNEVRVGGVLGGLYNRNFYGLMAAGEVDFQIVPDTLRLNIDPGLGISNDGQPIVMLKAGPMFLFGQLKSLGLGLEAVFLKEGFNDDGDAFLGAGLRFDAMFHRNVGLTLFCAVGADSSMVTNDVPGAEYARVRQSDIGAMCSAGLVVKSGGRR